MTKARSSRLVLAAIVGLLLANLASPWKAEGQGASKPPVPATGSSAVTTVQNHTLDPTLRGAIGQEVEKAVALATKSVTENATQVQARGDALIKYTSWVSSVFLGIVGLLIAGFLAMGWRELGLVSSARKAVNKTRTNVEAATSEAATAAKEAGRAATAVRDMEEQVTLASNRITAIDREITASIANLTRYFEEKPTYEFERAGIVGEAPELPAAERIARNEEADVMIVLADKLNSVPKETLVLSFIQLGYYWRLIQNFPRAIARFTRAIEIEPNSLSAHRGLCVAFYGLAAERGGNPTYKARLLAAANEECQKARVLEPNDPAVWFDEGWIADERGDYAAAVAAYKKARELDIEGKKPNILFNLACAYSKWGKQRKALEAISQVISVDRNWEEAQRDPDLEALRSDPTYGPQLLARIREQERRDQN